MWRPCGPRSTQNQHNWPAAGQRGPRNVLIRRETGVEQVLTADQPDPAELHKIDWELAAYSCRDYQRCYCRDGWQKTIIWDGPFCDYTVGVCPAGHRHMIDD